MWKKKENEPTPAPTAGRPDSPPSRPVTAPRRSERAVIGPTLRIHGEISGEEELLVQGQIDGKIDVKGQAVTVGKAGKVKADIHALSIRIEGEVRGDLFGEREVIIEASGDVEGNLIAPSVRLENGSRFKGSIDMEQAARPTASPPKPPQPGSRADSPKPSEAAGGETPSKPPSSGTGQSPMRS